MQPLRVYPYDEPPRSRLQDAVYTWGMSALITGLAFFCFSAYQTGTFTVFDTVSLIIHEAGHFFFRPLGPTLHLLGGSILQLLLPLLFLAAFARTEYRHGMQAALAWTGQNALNVSTYVADARERALPLLSGDPASHDWWQLLRAAGLLAYDDTIALGFLALAILAFATAVAIPRFLL